MMIRWHPTTATHPAVKRGGVKMLGLCTAGGNRGKRQARFKVAYLRDDLSLDRSTAGGGEALVSSALGRPGI